MNTRSDQLSKLHDRYVVAINMAVAQDNDLLVEQLAAEYDDEALALMGGATRTAA